MVEAGFLGGEAVGATKGRDLPRIVLQVSLNTLDTRFQNLMIAILGSKGAIPEHGHGGCGRLA